MKNFEPWPDDKEPDNQENWGWWDETPHRVSIEGPDDSSNIPTPIFEIMWERNPANRRELGSDREDDNPYGRWLLWDDIEIAREELKIALGIWKAGQ